MLRRIIDSPWLYFGLAGLLVVGAIASQFRIKPPRPAGTIADLATIAERNDVNLIYIVIDMLRSDRLHGYGYERGTSPIMDELGRTGIRYERVESQSSWTKASMASMWTGMYPERAGIQRFFHAMPPEAHLPPEILRDAGFRTAGIWRNGWVANNFGFDQGFDMYVRPAKVRPVDNVRRNTRSTHSLPGTDMDATLSAIEFLKGSLDQRFFLYIHYMDIHQYLYADVSPDFGTSFSDIYDSSIFWTDHNIGELMAALAEMELADRTVVAIVSDHGEAFFEHGIEGHARNLYREVLEVPWIIALPFTLEPGIVVPERVANVDVWPTLLDLFGLPPLEGAEGRSTLPMLEAAARGDAPADGDTDRPLFAQLDGSWGKVGAEPFPTVSVVKGRYRMNYALRNPEVVELYDRGEDPGETANVAKEQPEVASELREEIESFLATPKTQWEKAPEVELDEMRRNQLRALGYVIRPADPKTARKPGNAKAPE